MLKCFEIFAAVLPLLLVAIETKKIGFLEPLRVREFVLDST